LKEPCHLELNFVQQEQINTIQTILLENFGFGGQNSALIVRKID